MKIAKKAEMGMGTLIIFIAMILVAAVAAAVLISTTGSLQNKALDTGRSTTQEVGTSMQVIELYAEDGTTSTNVEEFVAIMKLSAGSEPIRFSDLLVTIALDDQSADFSFNSTINCSNATNTTAGATYGVQYAITGPDNQANYLTRGDVARVCFEAPRSVGESETVRLSIVPKVGSPIVVETTTPDLILNVRENLYP